MRLSDLLAFWKRPTGEVTYWKPVPGGNIGQAHFAVQVLHSNPDGTLKVAALPIGDPEYGLGGRVILDEPTAAYVRKHGWRGQARIDDKGLMHLINARYGPDEGPFFAGRGSITIVMEPLFKN